MIPEERVCDSHSNESDESMYLGKCSGADLRICGNECDQGMIRLLE